MASIEDRREKEPDKNWSKPYRVRWRDPVTDAQRSEHFRTLKEAKAKRREVETDGDLGMSTMKNRDVRRLTFGTLIDAFDADPRSVKQPRNRPAASYLKSIREHFPVIRAQLGTTPVIEVINDPRHLDRLDNHLTRKRKVKPATVNRYLSTVSMLYSYARQRRLVPVAWPPLHIHRHPEPKPKAGAHEFSLTQEDLQRIVLHAPAQHRALLWTATATGMRLGELLGLRSEDLFVSGGHHYIAVRRSREPDSVTDTKLPKTVAGVRDITIPADLANYLATHIKETEAARSRRPDLSLLFPTRAGTMIGTPNFERRVWLPTREAAKLPDDLEFRHVRRSYGSLLLAEGVPVVDVARIMGHDDIKTTLNTYARPQAATAHLVSETFAGLGGPSHEPQTLRKVLRVSSLLKVDEHGIHPIGADE